MNPLIRLGESGQSVWLDFLRRGLITGGGLERLLYEDGVSGVTSNPSIFRKAIEGSTDYDDAIRIIAVTAHGAEKDRQQSAKAGFELHLLKPVDPSVIQSLLA